MPTMTCAKCNATLDVGALAAGTEFACGGCGAMLRVPAAAPPKAAPASTTSRSAASPTSAASPPRPAAAAAAPARRAPAAAAPQATPATARGAGRPSRGRAAEPAAEKPAAAAGRRRSRDGGGNDAPAKKSPLVPLLAVAGVLVLGGIIFVATRGGSSSDTSTKSATEPLGRTSEKEKEQEKAIDAASLPAGKAGWEQAKTEKIRNEWINIRIAEAVGGDEKLKALHDLMVEVNRIDFARRAARARAEKDPGSEWAQTALGRKSLKADLEEFAGHPELDETPIEAWSRLKDRIEKESWFAEEGKDATAAAEDIAAVRAHLAELNDPWQKEARAVLAQVRAAPEFQKYSPIEARFLPPFLVMAQVNQDPKGHSTTNVLNNHIMLFQCLTREFLKVMGEANLPAPTIAEMGNPVLKAFIFTSRNNFDRWHWDQGQDDDFLKGVRAYYAWGSNQYMMLYDTGAPSGKQSSDICVAFHEASHQLVHYYRRYYVWLQDKQKNPNAPMPDLTDPRLRGSAHWFGEGFAEFFGGADRISTITGEYKLLRPLLERIPEWGNPYTRTEPQWTLEEIVKMNGKQHLDILSKSKYGEKEHMMNSLYYAQAWALNHFLYFGDDGKYRERYLKIVHEEMNVRSGYNTFMRCMGVGDSEEERKKFLEGLDEEWKQYQELLIRNLNKGK